jgi:hypothetical protein
LERNSLNPFEPTTQLLYVLNFEFAAVGNTEEEGTGDGSTGVGVGVMFSVKLDVDTGMLGTFFGVSEIDEAEGDKAVEEAGSWITGVTEVIEVDAGGEDKLVVMVDIFVRDAAIPDDFCVNKLLSLEFTSIFCDMGKEASGTTTGTGGSFSEVISCEEGKEDF